MKKVKLPLPDDGVSAEELQEFHAALKLQLSGLPDWFNALPTTAKNTALLDELQRAVYKRQITALVEEGMSRDEAKARILPTADGDPYLDVYLRMLNKPVQLNYGSASAAIPESVLAFIQEKALVNALLGLSSTNGGGPNVMHAWSYWPQVADQVVSRQKFVRAFEHVVAQVLLLIAKELPNGFGTPGYVVRPADSLQFRTNALLTLGDILSICVFIGGHGTHEEIFRTAVDNQLQEHINTTVAHPVPIVFMDFPRANGELYWSHFREHVQWLVEDGCIKPKDADSFHYIRVDDPNAVRDLTLLQESVGRDYFGYDIVEDWNKANKADVFEVAKELFPELLSFGSIAQFPVKKAANGG